MTRGLDYVWDHRWRASIAAAHAQVPAELPPCHHCGTRRFWVLALAGDRWVCNCTGRHTVITYGHGVRVQ